MQILPSKPKKINGLSTGCYFLLGGTKSGKTLHSLAFSLMKDFSYIYCNEPRAVADPSCKLYDLDGAITINKITSELASFKNTGLIIDSISDQFLPGKSPAMRGGLTPDQLLVSRRLNFAASKENVVLICTLNSQLVPSPDVFEGAIEGLIRIVEKGTVSIVNRDNRKETLVNIDEGFMNRACHLLDYGDYISPKRIENSEIYTSSYSLSKTQLREL